MLSHTVLKKNLDQNLEKITVRGWEIFCGGIFWGYIWGQILHRNPSGTPWCQQRIVPVKDCHSDIWCLIIFEDERLNQLLFLYWKLHFVITWNCNKIVSNKENDRKQNQNKRNPSDDGIHRILDISCTKHRIHSVARE